jgi:hypothetical protein
VAIAGGSEQGSFHKGVQIKNERAGIKASAAGKMEEKRTDTLPRSEQAKKDHKFSE